MKVREGVDFHIIRGVNVYVTALRCERCAFLVSDDQVSSVIPLQWIGREHAVGSARYNRLRGVMVKHVHEAHRLALVKPNP